MGFVGPQVQLLPEPVTGPHNHWANWPLREGRQVPPRARHRENTCCPNSTEAGGEPGGREHLASTLSPSTSPHRQAARPGVEKGHRPRPVSADTAKNRRLGGPGYRVSPPTPGRDLPAPHPLPTHISIPGGGLPEEPAGNLHNILCKLISVSDNDLGIAWSAKAAVTTLSNHILNYVSLYRKVLQKHTDTKSVCCSPLPTT